MLYFFSCKPRSKVEQQFCFAVGLMNCVVVAKVVAKPLRRLFRITTNRITTKPNCMVSLLFTCTRFKRRAGVEYQRPPWSVFVPAPEDGDIVREEGGVQALISILYENDQEARRAAAGGKVASS